jgi:transposase InsO family protein
MSEKRTPEQHETRTRQLNPITRSRPMGAPSDPQTAGNGPSDPDSDRRVSRRSRAWTTAPERPKDWVGPVHWGSPVQAPPELLARAERKLAWIRGFVDRGCPHGQLMTCAQAHARAAGIPEKEIPPYKTLNHWVHRFQQYGLVGLVDSVRSDAGSMRSISSEVAKLLEIFILGSGNVSPTDALAFLSLVLPGRKLPRYRNLARWIRHFRRDNPGDVEMAMNGEIGYRNRIRLSIATNGMPAGYAFAIDSTPADVVIKVPSREDVREWSWVRPWLTTVEDLGSRAFITFNVSLEPVTSEILLSTFRKAVIQEANYEHLLSLGVPAEIHVDGGAENRGAFAQAMQSLGVDVKPGKARNPRHNAHIESLIGTISSELFPHLPGSTAKSVPFDPDGEAPGSSNRTLKDLEYESLKTEIPVESLDTLEEFETRIQAWAVHYNERGHSSLPVDSEELRHQAEVADRMDAQARRVA